MENLTGLVAVFLIFMIPLAAILVGGLKMWLDFKSKQDQLGSSTHDLEDAVQQLEAARENLVRRIENLEAIVTREEWDALPEGKERGDAFLSLNDAEDSASEPARRSGPRRRSS